MFCMIMCSSIEVFREQFAIWCSERYSIITKTWLLIFLMIIVYLFIMLASQLVSYITDRVECNPFEELYQAVSDNNTLLSLRMVKMYPQYVNKFKYPDGYTPFMVACANANTQLVKYMIRLGADVNLKSKSKENPLYLVAFYYIQNRQCKNASCIRELFLGGVDINAIVKNNMTTIQIAAIFGHTALVKWLLNKNASIKVYPHPYLLAKAEGHHEAARCIANSINFRSIEY